MVWQQQKNSVTVAAIRFSRVNNSIILNLKFPSYTHGRTGRADRRDTGWRTMLTIYFLCPSIVVWMAVYMTVVWDGCLGAEGVCRASGICWCTRAGGLSLTNL